MPDIPPLRISTTEGDFNQIPVFEIEASGAIITKLSPIKVRLAFTGATANTSAIVYAATGNKYVVMDLAGDLTSEHRLVQSGNSISIVTAAGLVTINATTSDITGKQDSVTFPLIIGSGGTGLSLAGSATALLGVNSSDSIGDWYYLRASDNITITRVGTHLLISATTNAGGGSGTVNAGSAGNIAYYPSAGTTVDDLLVGSATTILGVNSSGASHDYYLILASDNATIVKSGTAIYVSATTNAGGGSGTVNTGSANYLAYYPSAGTTVDDAPISVTTGSEIAPLNINILTSAAANSANGDIWFQSSSNIMYIFVRSNNSNYFVAMNT